MPWPSALIAEIDSPVAELAILVRIERRDGAIIGFTSWDQPLTKGGLVYSPDAGVRLTATNFTVGTGVDDTEARALLDVSAITADDVRSGRYQGASYEIGICIPSDPTIYGVHMAGSFGAQTVDGSEVVVEMKGLTALLKRSRGDVTSKQCRCRRLGDAQCKLNLAGNVRGYPITKPTTCTSFNGKTILVTHGPEISGFYAFGTVEATSGPNAGIKRDVKTSSRSGGVTTIVLREPFPFAFVSPFDIVVTAGCNRLLKDATGADSGAGSTCSDFGNCNNFHGEWDLPGNTKVLKAAEDA